MKINLKHTLATVPEILLIPVPQSDNLKKFYQELEQSIGAIAPQQKKDFSADQGELLTIYTPKSKIFLLGLGKEPSFSTIVKTARSFAFKNKKLLSSKLAVSFLHCMAENVETTIDAVVNGLALSVYKIGRFQTDQSEQHPFKNKAAKLTLVVDKKLATPAKKAAKKGQAAAATQLSAIELVNAPANKKEPSVLANWAKESGKKHGYEVTVFDKKKIESLGMGGLLAVNRGSEAPPAFIIMEYKPNKTNGKLRKIGIVGKGVTFDTGGLSIKPSNNMHYMKSDMGGAAAVLGTMELVAKLQLPVHLIGIVPSTDNSVDALAIKPSDVITSYSGKTIEIIDTDAEGRLILADGIAYMAKHFKPEVMIDLATLTGSAVRALGYEAGALFSNNDKLVNQLSSAGERMGERLWRLPMWDEYKSDIQSDVADVKNFSGKPVAGAISAAKFLEFFTAEHPAWAHLDIAGVAFGSSEYSVQKSANGFGIRLLTDLLEKEYCN